VGASAGSGSTSSTGIGVTSREIATVLPLPLDYLWALLATTARQLGMSLR
jgi:hypothetical protein